MRERNNISSTTFLALRPLLPRLLRLLLLLPPLLLLLLLLLLSWPLPFATFHAVVTGAVAALFVDFLLPYHCFYYGGLREERQAYKCPRVMEAIIHDLLLIRADREKYYYGCLPDQLSVALHLEAEVRGNFQAEGLAG